MNIRVCDVCRKNGKIVESKFRKGYVHGIKIDLCTEHRSWGKDLRRDDFGQACLKLMFAI